jgi:nucleoside-diphosphate-sugar epimerase
LARVLIVGCGCRGRALGARLAAEGWSVRGTTRSEAGSGEIEAAGIEAAVADPIRPGTVLDLIGDVTVVHWLMGSAAGEPEAVGAIHGARLQALLERLVDTPVRGFAYEAAGAAAGPDLGRGAEVVRAAATSWRIPVEIVEADPARHQEWLQAMLAATRRLIA